MPREETAFSVTQRPPEEAPFARKEMAADAAALRREDTFPRTFFRGFSSDAGKRESWKAGKRDRPFPAGNVRGGEISGYMGNRASGEYPWEEILAEMRGKR